MNRWRHILILGGLSILSLGVYWGLAVTQYGAGFPLDDAWIHQTYARNIALYGEWSFVRGQPSAGLTAPLWGLLLVPGYWAGLMPYSWTIMIGWLTLWGFGVLGFSVARRIFPDNGWAAWVFGIVFIFEWHLVWAALSGMETLLFSVLIAIILLWTMDDPPRLIRDWIFIGCLIGLSIWIRPEGLTLIGPAGLLVIFENKKWRERLLDGVVLLISVGGWFVSYLLFNRWLAGAWWPNTFYAKQAEYSELLLQPLFLRISQQLSLPLIGVGLVLLPGFIYLIVVSIHRRNWPIIISAIWVFGFLGLYALRLPVTYQHGRYAIPGMPIYLFLGLWGSIDYLKNIQRENIKKLSQFSWLALVFGLLMSFYWLGADSYVTDVGIINTEMVETARWVDQNLPEESLIAAHDIGALGYFAQRQLLDLAGLISPDVIPFIRDEVRLEQFITNEGVEYLIVFPDWYKNLSEVGVLVFQTGGDVSLKNGGENMAVYRWNIP